MDQQSNNTPLSPEPTKESVALPPPPPTVVSTSPPSPPVPTRETSQSSPSKKSTPFRRLLLVSLIIILIVVVSTEIVLLWQAQEKSSSPVISTVPKVTTKIQEPLFLTIESPTESTQVVDQKVVVKGKTLPGTAVAIYSETDQTSVESDTSGNFEGTINLTDGINTLTVTAFGENGEEKSVTLDVVYDSQS